MQKFFCHITSLSEKKPRYWCFVTYLTDLFQTQNNHIMNLCQTLKRMPLETIDFTCQRMSLTQKGSEFGKLFVSLCFVKLTFMSVSVLQITLKKLKICFPFHSRKATSTPTVGYISGFSPRCLFINEGMWGYSSVYHIYSEKEARTHGGSVTQQEVLQTWGKRSCERFQ